MKWRLIIPCLIAALACAGGAIAGNNIPGMPAARPLSFIENKGQVTDQWLNSRNDIQYSVRAAGGLTVYIGNGALHYQFSRPGAAKGEVDMYRMDVTLEGADMHAAAEACGEEDFYESHFTNGLHITAHAYDKITYKNVYPGIDWVFRVKDGNVKHEFVVRPGGRVADIKLKYSGATSLTLATDGTLLATTPQGSVAEQAPVSYGQAGEVVSSTFVLSGNILSYKVASHSGVLTIDPTLQWGTYFTGNLNETVLGVTTDVAGNAYIAGNTQSTSGIATVGAYQVTCAGLNDVFIAKFSSLGVLQWATYYGGTHDDAAYYIAAGADGIFVAGTTTSPTGIATAGTHQDTLGGATVTDAFLSKFSLSGTLVWGTYFGGSGVDDCRHVAIDPSGNVYIAGTTTSTTNIATAGAYQTIQAGGSSWEPDDAYIAKFSATGGLLWATYYGGSGDDQGESVTTDASGNVYFAGITTSTSAIATGGAYQGSYMGGSFGAGDGFLAKFSSAGARQWATYFGGPAEEAIQAVLTDAPGNVYIVGSTASSSGIATAGAYQAAYGGISSGSMFGDGFLAKFNNTGGIQWATYYGGEKADQPSNAVIDNSGNIYLCGGTASATGIASPGAYDTAFGGGDTTLSAFLARFSTGGTLQWGTYYHGNKWQWGNNVAADNMGGVYMCGQTTSTTGIATPGAYQTALADGGLYPHAYLVKFLFCTLSLIDTISGPSTICAGSAITLSDAVAGGTWSATNTHATVSAGGLVTAINAGADTIRYTIVNSCGPVSVSHTVTVEAHLFASPISGRDTLCVSGDTLHLSDTVAGGAWSVSHGHATITAAGVVQGITTGADTVIYIVANSCGSDTATLPIVVSPCDGAVQQYAYAGNCVTVIPNPAQSIIHIAAYFAIKNVVITNMLGQQVYSIAGNSTTIDADISSLPPGVYLVRINDWFVERLTRQ